MSVISRAIDAVRGAMAGGATGAGAASDAAPPAETTTAQMGEAVKKDSSKGPAAGRGMAGAGMVGKKSLLARRHQRGIFNGVRAGVGKRDLRRVARRAGVKRLSGGVYEEADSALRCFMRSVLRDTALYVEHARRKTVTAMDVVRALKRNNITLYGYGDAMPLSYSIERRAANIARSTHRRRSSDSSAAFTSEDDSSVEASPVSVRPAGEITAARFDELKLVVSRLFSERRIDKLPEAEIIEAAKQLDSSAAATAERLSAEVKSVLETLEEDGRVVLNGTDVYLM